MANLPFTLEKLLFFDIETTGMRNTYEDLKTSEPRLATLWAKRCVYLRERYSVNIGKTDGQLWVEKSGLHAEFSNIACVSFGYYVDGMPRLESFDSSVSEYDLLMKMKGVINNGDRNGFFLCGHTIKRFDMPFTWKRMLINKITPPRAINFIGVKSWDIHAVDIAELWGGGAWQEGFTSLDTMSAVSGIASPKGETEAKMVHELYWNGEHDRIVKYCEGDVIATMEVAKSIYNTLSGN